MPSCGEVFFCCLCTIGGNTVHFLQDIGEWTESFDCYRLKRVLTIYTKKIVSIVSCGHEASCVPCQQY